MRAAEAGATGPDDLDDSLESEDVGGLPVDSADLLLDLLEWHCVAGRAYPEYLVTYRE